MIHEERPRLALASAHLQGLQGKIVLVVTYLVFLKLFIFFAVAIFDLVHGVEAIYYIT